MVNRNKKNTIVNNLWLNSCPCCKSTSLSTNGIISYSISPSYSSLKIKLSEKSELWICNDCESLFTQNRIQESCSVELYTIGDSWSSGKFEGVKTEEAKDLMDSLVKPGHRLLDVGCANGSLLDYVKSKGALTYGLEYSRSNIDKLQSNHHIAFTDWSDIDEHFDIITAFDVVEHLYDLDSFLTSCLEHLSINGFLVILTGDVNSFSAQTAKNMWWYVRRPEHILFPSLKYLSSLSDFQVKTTVKTYPSKFLRQEYPQPIRFFRNIKNIFANILSSFFLNDFAPSPLIQPDHILIVLQKKDE